MTPAEILAAPPITPLPGQMEMPAPAQGDTVTTTPPTDQRLAEIRAHAEEYGTPVDWAATTLELLNEIDRQRREAVESDRQLGLAIDRADDFHDVADRLASAIAPIEVIGEHSSMNDPWENAYQLATSAAEVNRLRAIADHAQKLVGGWRDSAGDHALMATLDKTLDEPMRMLQSGRGESLSDCASELESVLEGQDPDTWDHGIAVEVQPAEAAAQ